MRNYPASIALSFILSAFALGSLVSLQAQGSEDEQTLWKFEHGYWSYVQDNDLHGYLALWHKSFLGWPSSNATPVHKDHITDWITTQTSQGLAFRLVEFKPAAIQVTGDVAVTCYWITYKWVNKSGEGETHTRRVTHTLLRDGKDWHILGGMSTMEDGSAGK